MLLFALDLVRVVSRFRGKKRCVCWHCDTFVHLATKLVDYLILFCEQARKNWNAGRRFIAINGLLRCVQTRLGNGRTFISQVATYLGMQTIFPGSGCPIKRL